MARKNLGAKPYLMPMPVLMLSAYDENEKPCAMLAVWGGISNEKEVTITVASERHTLKGILARQAFVVSMGDVENVVACDYLGITKGEKVPDKFEKSGFHATKSEFVDAPLIDELPFAVECKVKSYDPDNWRLVGEIVNVSLDERILGENGKKGHLLKASGGQLLFLPGNGYIYDETVGTPDEGFYWAANDFDHTNAHVTYLPVNSWGQSNYGRYIGIGIRPIRIK